MELNNTGIKIKCIIDCIVNCGCTYQRDLIGVNTGSDLVIRIIDLEGMKRTTLGLKTKTEFVIMGFIYIYFIFFFIFNRLTTFILFTYFSQLRV